MTKTEKKEAAYKLITPFFKTFNTRKKQRYQKEIEALVFKDVNVHYNFGIIEDAMTSFQHDINEYLHCTMDANTAPRSISYKAYLALRGIIDLVDILEEKETTTKK